MYLEWVQLNVVTRSPRIMFHVWRCIKNARKQVRSSLAVVQTWFRRGLVLRFQIGPVENSGLGPVFPFQKDYMSATNPVPSLDPPTSPLNGLRTSHPSCLPPRASPSTFAIPKPFSLLPNQKVLKSVAVRTIRQSHRARKRAISDMYGLLCFSACVCLIHPLDLAVVDQVLFRSHSSSGDLFPYRAAGGYNMYNPHTHSLSHTHTYPPNGDS